MRRVFRFHDGFTIFPRSKIRNIIAFCTALEAPSSRICPFFPAILAIFFHSLCPELIFSFIHVHFWLIVFLDKCSKLRVFKRDVIFISISIKIINFIHNGGFIILKYQSLLTSYSYMSIWSKSRSLTLLAPVRALQVNITRPTTKAVTISFDIKKYINF